MANQDQKRASKQSKTNRSLSEGEDGQRKGPRFNIYWIYALAAIFLIGYQVVQGVTPDAAVITDLKFKQQMLSRNHVEKIEPVKNKDLVRVYINKDSLNQAFYKDLLKEKYDFVKNSKGPH